MSAQSVAYQEDLRPLKVSMSPMGGAMVASFVFVSMLIMNATVLWALAATILFVALQVALLMLVMGVLRAGGKARFVRGVSGILVPTRHAVSLYAACAISAGLGSVPLASLASLAAFCAFIAVELVAVIALSSRAGQPGYAALHVSDSSLGMAGIVV